jgi:hypothetical protein
MISANKLAKLSLFSKEFSTFFSSQASFSSIISRLLSDLILPIIPLLLAHNVRYLSMAGSPCGLNNQNRPLPDKKPISPLKNNLSHVGQGRI